MSPFSVFPACVLRSQIGANFRTKTPPSISKAKRWQMASEGDEVVVTVRFVGPYRPASLPLPPVMKVSLPLCLSLTRSVFVLHTFLIKYT